MAISETTRAERSHVWLVLPLPTCAPSLRLSIRFVRKAAKAGARLHRTPVATATRRAKLATIGFTETELMRGMDSGTKCKVVWMAIAADARPSRPPATLNSRPSTTDSRMILLELAPIATRSEEHTSELQSRLHLVCRLLLEKKYTFYVPHRHVYGEQWIKFMKDGVNATPLPTVNTTGYIDHAAFLGTINPDTNKIPKHLFQGYLNIYNNYFKAPWMPDRTEANPNELNQDDARYGFR